MICIYYLYICNLLFVLLVLKGLAKTQNIDLKGDIGAETLSTVLTGMKLSGDPPCGVRYETHSKPKEFEFKDWGAFNLIGFLAEGYFAGYIENTKYAEKNLFFKQSSDNNVLSHGRLLKVLIDDDTERTVVSNSPLKLAEGYELNITSIDLDGREVNIELSKDGSVVDKKVVSPSKDGATMADRTYFYKNPAVGDLGSLITIAVHFKNAFRGSDTNLATVDGIWQLSIVPIDVEVDTEYDKMRIASVSADTITMDNKDNTITLSKNKDIDLMGDIKIKTSDQDVIDDVNPQRYYIYKEVTIGGAAAPVVEAEPAVEAAPAAEEAPAVEENRTAEAPVAEAAAPANMSANYAYEAKKGENLASFETTIYAIIAVLFLFGFTILLSLAELWAIKKIGFDVAANLSIKGEYGNSGIQFDAVGVMAFLIFQPLMIFYLVNEVAAMLVS